ncbi:MAG: transglutaminase-like domain-containing protein [Marinisporobacter sp.]|jgi:hypothetical protein|nr:transglutaminase-like domain-containing protein [Marinisporobacter sp.]
MSNTKDYKQPMGIRISFPEKQNNETIKQVAPQLLIILLLNGFGIVLTLSSAFKLPYNMAIVAGFVVLYALIYGSIFLFIQKPRIVVSSMSVLFCLICTFFRATLYEGFNQTIGWMSEVIEECSDKILPWTLNAGTTYETIPMTLFFVAVLFPLMLLLSYAIIHRFNIFLLLLITVPILEITLFLGCLPSVVAFVLLLLGSFSLFVLNQSTTKPGKQCFDVRSDLSLKKQAGNSSLVIVGIVGVLVMVCWLLVSQTDYKAFTNNFSLRSQTGERIKKIMSFAYEEKTPPQGGITGGQFSETDQFSFKGETVLTVEADELRGSIYLKGYVGGDYTSNGWEPLPDKLSKEGEKLSKKLQVGKLPSKVINYDNAMLSKLFHAEKRLLKVTKTDEALMQYQYVPYNLSDESINKLYINEYGTISKDQCKNNSYSALYYDVLNYDNNLFLLNRKKIKEQLYGNLGIAKGSISTEQVDDYLSKEKEYADFVHEAYTRLPNNLSKRMIDEFSTINKDLTIESIIKTVMGNLSERAVYTLTPGETPNKKDYVDYFLYENQKGYCTHFASAATVIFRLSGIPARYVEGYVVTVKDYTRASRTDEGRYIMNIKDTNSHAWCEIYLDGFGWVPVEVTPGLVSVNTGGVAPASGESIEYETNEESEINDIPMEIPQIENTSTEAKADDQLGKGKENTVSGRISCLWMMIMIAILLVSILFILPLSLSKRAVKRRIKELQNKSRNQSTLSWYTYMMDVLKLVAPQYLKNREISDLAWAEEMEKKTVFPFEKFLWAMSVIQKSAYSQKEISTSEYESLVKFLENAVKHLYEGLPTCKKLKWRYINRLPIYAEILKEGEKN